MYVIILKWWKHDEKWIWNSSYSMQIKLKAIQQHAVCVSYKATTTIYKFTSWFSLIAAINPVSWCSKQFSANNLWNPLNQAKEVSN